MAETDVSFPKPPLGYTALRRVLRAGLSHQARQQWWPSLPRIPDGDGINSFQNIQELATNRLKWADSTREFDNKGSTLEQKVAYVVQLLNNQYHMSDPDLLMPLIQFVTKELIDIAAAFSTLCDVCDRGEWFFAVEPSQHRVRLETFRVLLERNNSGLYGTLKRIGALEDRFLNIFFINLFVDVFPDESVMRTVSFFNER